MAQKKEAAALRGATGFEHMSLIDSSKHTTLAAVQTSWLARHFQLSAELARAVAALAFREARL